MHLQRKKVMLTDQEMKIVRGRPSSSLQAAAKLYVSDSAERERIDKADEVAGTETGAKLRRLFYGLPEPAAPATQQPEPTAKEVADAVRAFPKERVLDLYKGTTNPRTGDSFHSEKLSALKPEEREQSKLAAKFWNVQNSGDGGASVRFNYQTPRDRQAKREAREAAAADAERKRAEALPPGVTRDKDGNLGLADPVAFENWKREKSEHADAVKFLEEQAAA